jgi:DNA-binding transcriptional MocR family regulator
MHRYRALAAEIEASILTRVLQPGDRLPSVRQASAQRRLSASTVFQAYYLLEARGLIRARERSGYFVSPRKPALPEPQELSPLTAPSVPADVAEAVFQVLEASMQRSVVPFGSAFPSPALFPLVRLGKAMAASAKSLTPWSTLDEMSPGKESLRRQIALRYAADGIRVTPADIVITNGALEALNLCLSAVARPGDSVVVESPTFYAALQAIDRLGLKVIEAPTHPGKGIDLDRLEQVIRRDKPKACWFMTTFQNPLGCTLPDDRKKQLVALLARHQVALIEDDVYAELYFGARRPLPAKAFDQEGLVLHCSSFSKCLAPGYRVGWAVPGRFRQAVARTKLATTLGASAPAQLGLVKYLEAGGYDKHLRKLRQTLATHQAAFSQALCTHLPPGSRATRPEGGYFMWVELPAGTDAMALHRKALHCGISIAPGPIFSAGNGFTNCVRLNYGHPLDSKAERGLELLGRLLARPRAGSRPAPVI